MRHEVAGHAVVRLYRRIFIVNVLSSRVQNSYNPLAILERAATTKSWRLSPVSGGKLSDGV